jgi:hypothetical protein
VVTDCSRVLVQSGTSADAGARARHLVLDRLHGHASVKPIAFGAANR